MNQIDFSSKERELVKNRSSELYKELLDKRQALGFGEYDNSTPDAIKKLYGEK